jgi:hypothetical protein
MPVVATAALADAPVVLAGASVARVASPTNRPAAGACSSTASAALGDGNGGFHLPGERPPLLSSFPDDEFSEVTCGGVPAARATSTPHPAAPGARAV